jgi:hypothetical protein
MRRQDRLAFWSAAVLSGLAPMCSILMLPLTPIFAGVSSLLHVGVDSLILRDPHDAKTLATMIRTLYQKVEWRSRVGQAAAKASLEWTWDHNVAAVWELLKDAAGRNPLARSKDPSCTKRGSPCWAARFDCFARRLQRECKRLFGNAGDKGFDHPT